MAHVGCARATEQPISLRLRWSHTDIDGPTSFTLRPPHSLPTNIKTSKYALSPLCVCLSCLTFSLISLSHKSLVSVVGQKARGRRKEILGDIQTKRLQTSFKAFVSCQLYKERERAQTEGGFAINEWFWILLLEMCIV